MSSSSDDDMPLEKRRSVPKVKTEVKKRKTTIKNENYLESDDDAPLKKRAKSNGNNVHSNSSEAHNGTASDVKPQVKKEAKKSDSEGTVKKAGSKAKVTTKVKTESKSSATNKKDAGLASSAKKVVDNKEDNTPLSSRKPKKEKAQTPSSLGNEDKSASQLEREQEEEEEFYKWWEAEQNDGSVKWTTLSHQGVLFPPPYEPLPAHVKLKYQGKPVDLPIEAEEVAGFFGAMLETEHAKNKTFQKNFFEDFKKVLHDCKGPKPAIEEFELCDFTDIFNYYEEKRQQKKSMTTAEKKKLKQEKDELEKKYKVCYLDGRKEMVGNFRIEPPGLFRGRGTHPKTGKLKTRVQPEQVTINIGREAEVPSPPPGHQWAEVKHNNTVTWLATWKENINGATKYVMLSANSSLKGMSDLHKFEKARNLKNHIARIRKDYTRELNDEVMANRQRATAMYLIDVLALRAGGEKGEDEADTVGCCSLRYEHVTLKPPNIVVFDFLGKDSIRFHQEVKVEPQVYKNLKLFKKPPHKVGDQLFDRLDPPTLNKHLQNYMPGLSAKVFRTFNASKTMQEQIDKIPNKGTVNEKYIAYNAANRAVAILCNHQRTVTKSHEVSVGKIEDKILEMKFQRYRLKLMIAQLDRNLVKADPDYFQRDDELDDETIDRLVEQIIQRERDKITKKFLRENEKRVSENEEPLPETKLQENLQEVDKLAEEYKQERNTHKPEVKNGMTVEKLQSQIAKINERIINTSLQLKDKEDNSTVALTTSKINYIDPRLTVMFSKKFDVPLEKLFSKTLRDKFKWAIESADENWRF